MTKDATEALLGRVSEGVRALHAYKTPPDPLPIKLDANESPFCLDDGVLRELGEITATLDYARYPDISQRKLKAAVARYAGTAEERLVLGVGSDEVLAVLVSTLSMPRAKAPVLVVPDPTFVMYAHFAHVHGLEVVQVPLQGPDFTLDLPSMHQAIRAHDAALVILATPNNPTGTVLRDADILTLAEAHPSTFVVVDEAYGAFRTTTHRASLPRLPNLLFTGTLSKIGIAALRIGWLEAPPWLVRELDKVRLPFNVPTPSQLLAAHLLDVRREAIDLQVMRILEGREALLRGIEACSFLRAIPTEANFLLAELPTAEMAARLVEHLAREGVQVRAFLKGTLSRHLRITVGTPTDIEALDRALQSFDGASATLGES